MTTIYLDKTLENLGYSSAKVFECDIGYATIGGTASGAAPRQSLMTFNAFGIVVVDHRPASRAFFKTETDEEKKRFMIRVILDALTPETFVEVMEKIRKDALAIGKGYARAEIRHALGITVGF